MFLTNPRSPLVIAGVNYDHWYPVGTPGRRATQLAVRVTQDQSQEFIPLLGNYLPGLLEDGTPVTFYISVVHEDQIVIIPEVHATGGIL